MSGNEVAAADPLGPVGCQVKEYACASSSQRCSMVCEWLTLKVKPMPWAAHRVPSVVPDKEAT